MLRRQPGRVLDLPARKPVAVAQQRGELPHERLHTVEALRIALHHEFVPAGADLYGEQVAEKAEVLVVGTKEDFDALIWYGYGSERYGGDTRRLLSVQRQ
jgi:hypothetical protein